MNTMTPISSSANENFKLWKSLNSSKGIKSEGLFLLSGEKLVQEFLLKKNLKIVAELVPAGGHPLCSDLKAFELAKPLFNEIDDLGTHFNILVLEQPEIKSWSPALKFNGLQLICPLGDPGNLGALLRSAEAFGVAQVILTEESANPFLPKAVKASAGSVLKISLFKTAKLSEFIADSQTTELIALDLNGTPLPAFTWPQQGRLVVGEEGPGLTKLLTAAMSPNSKLKKISIPTLGVESLNAVVATSIALYDFATKSKK